MTGLQIPEPADADQEDSIEVKNPLIIIKPPPKITAAESQNSRVFFDEF